VRSGDAGIVGDPAEIREARPQRHEVSGRAVELPREGTELLDFRRGVATIDLSCSQRDFPLDPPLFGLERQRVRIAVGEDVLDRAEVVRGRVDERVDLLEYLSHVVSPPVDSPAFPAPRQGPRVPSLPGPRPNGGARSVGWVVHNHPVRRLLVIALFAVLAFAPLARADAPPLSARLAHALEVPGLSAAASGAIAIDLTTGQTLFERNPDTPLAPASNEKLTLTISALLDLGDAYRFRTEVLGRGHQDGAVWVGDVYLKGFGDPTLTSLGLERLATQLKLAGITQIEGRVLGDESWFDSERTAPGWKASFLINDCPPLSALAVDRDVYDHHVALSPALAAAGQFRRLLRKHGIAAGAAGLGRAPDDAYGLAQIESDPLPEVIAAMDRDSDNFIAEELLKVLGADVGAGGTTAAGAAIVRRDLAAAGIPLAGVRIVDGSGLSLGDRLTARALSLLLAYTWNDPDLKQPVWAALPVAGVSGTLEDRMQRAPARGAVRAKTGTTDRASALSGYVRDRYAFVVIENGRPIATSSARRAQDRFATALASAL
jgi:serine-type D-Ala-D-Ala carboxypeptidase/endopeptidase (penicillin-binding protein 4)